MNLQQRLEAPAAVASLFDGFGHLTIEAHEAVRRRLNESGIWGAGPQSRMLAAQIGHADAGGIWAMLMWNARPCPALAEKIEAWMLAGMPLPGLPPLVAPPPFGPH